MPTPTYVPLATVTLGSSASSVTFSSIPATYRDLVLVCNWQNSGSGSAGRLQLNGNTGANYFGVWMTGTGTSAISSSETSETSARIAGASVGPANTYSNTAILQFLDYSATDKHKTVISRFGSASTESQATASRYASTSAITSIRFFDILGQTFQTGSTFNLYGIVS
jgi:hypothetical protein